MVQYLIIQVLVHCLLQQWRGGIFGGILSQALNKNIRQIGQLTSAEKLHDQPQLIFHHEGGVVRHDVGVVALAHGLNLFLRREREKEKDQT